MPKTIKLQRNWPYARIVTRERTKRDQLYDTIAFTIIAVALPYASVEGVGAVFAFLGGIAFERWWDDD